MLVRWALLRAIPKWLWAAMLGIIITMAWWLFLYMPWVTLVGHNHTGYPIIAYWVNHSWGGNMYRSEYEWLKSEDNIKGEWNGWSGTSCCWPFSGDIANVLWVINLIPPKPETFNENNKGPADLETIINSLPTRRYMEEHSVKIPMPERTRDDRYLHIHFLPDNQVELAWSSTLLSPFENHAEPEINENHQKQRET